MYFRTSSHSTFAFLDVTECFCVLPQVSLEHAAGAVEARHDRPDGHIDDPGDLRVRQPLQGGKQKDNAEALWQALQSRPQPVVDHPCELVDIKGFMDGFHFVIGCFDLGNHRYQAGCNDRRQSPLLSQVELLNLQLLLLPC